jgi:hypothetical protein
MKTAVSVPDAIFERAEKLAEPVVVVLAVGVKERNAVRIGKAVINL